MLQTLGLAVVTKNEEKNIEQCLKSVPFASKVVVVDSLSTDKTVEVATKLGAKVITREWPGYAKQKQFAMDQLQTDWILVLDADESLTLEAQDEIKKIIQEKTDCSGFRLPIYPVFMERILKYGKGPSFPLRLIKKGQGTYSTREVHEEILIKGDSQYLNHGAIHASSLNIISRYDKIKRDLLLELQYTPNKKISLNVLFFNPIRYFFSHLVRKSAWKDGVPGIIWLALFTFQIFLQNALQYEKYIQNNSFARTE